MRGYDPLEYGRRVYRRVARRRGGVEERLYFRFRRDRWYGGVVSADVIGCNLTCKFCWAWYFRDDPRRGRWFDPRTAAEKLLSMAETYGVSYVRLTGGEPTIARSHLLDLIGLVTGAGRTFILETNGILLGADRTYAQSLSRYEGLVVRVSFKGVTPEEFAMLTGADGDAWFLQLRALENLLRYGMEPNRNLYVAAMVGWSREDDMEWFLDRLGEIDPALTQVEWEYVILYKHVLKLIKKSGLPPPRRAIEP